MELYLIRHAQSQNNALPEEQRVEDPSLTEVGHAQAAHLARLITSLKLTRLITSPFLRTLQTAEYLQKSIAVTSEVWIELHEQGGCVSGPSPEVMVGRPGMTQAEINARFPAYNIAPEIDSQGWWKSQPYETQAQAEHRAGRLLKKTRDHFAQTDERVAFVTHADIKRLFLELFHHEPLGATCNTSVTKVVITADESRPQVLADYNDVRHLPESLVTQ